MDKKLKYTFLIFMCLAFWVLLVLTIDVFLIGGSLFGILTSTITIIPIYETAKGIYLLAIED